MWLVGAVDETPSSTVAPIFAMAVREPPLRYAHETAGGRSGNTRITLMATRFLYQAASWKTARWVVAGVEFHGGEMFPRVGLIVTKLERSMWKTPIRRICHA
jgi:hypothetical protein